MGCGVGKDRQDLRESGGGFTGSSDSFQWVPAGSSSNGFRFEKKKIIKNKWNLQVHLKRKVTYKGSAETIFVFIRGLSERYP